jgi:hypothetical protein
MRQVIWHETYGKSSVLSSPLLCVSSIKLLWTPAYSENLRRVKYCTVFLFLTVRVLTWFSVVLRDFWHTLIDWLIEGMKLNEGLCIRCTLCNMRTYRWYGITTESLTLYRYILCPTFVLYSYFFGLLQFCVFLCAIVFLFSIVETLWDW